jgi:uncharacterized membrane protein YjjB (DUF3815 family)
MTAHFVNLIDELRRRSLRLASQVEDMLLEASDVIFHPVETLAQRILLRDEEVDEEEVRIETEVIRLLALYQPVGSDLRLLLTILKVTNDLERIADCAVNIAGRSKHLQVQGVAARSEHLKRMIPLVRRMMPVTAVYFCYGWTLWLYLSWLPSFFQNEFGFNTRESAFFSAAVYFPGVIGNVLGGEISDRILHKTGDLKRARRNLAMMAFLASFVCMLPGTAAYTFAGGALSEGRGDVRRTLGYLAVAGVLLVLVSLIPRWLQRRSRVAGDLLRAGVMAVLLADPADAQALAARAETSTEAHPSDAARFARWANAYNLLAIKAVLDQDPTTRR